jgi:hypothetical protein
MFIDFGLIRFGYLNLYSSMYSGCISSITTTLFVASTDTLVVDFAIDGLPGVAEMKPLMKAIKNKFISSFFIVIWFD